MKVKETLLTILENLRWQMHHFFSRLANLTQPKALPDVAEPEKTEGNSLAPFLKQMGRTPEEQQQKNQAGIELIRGWLAEEITEQESKQRELHFELLKEILDKERPSGYKLFSQE